MTTPDNLPPNAIAVIGMAGRFPGADSVTEFWENLRRGEESIQTLSEEDLTAAGVSARTLADPAYVRRAALLSGIEEFDADYFEMTPYTARMMDPQQRLFLQTAWHALEDSGYDPAAYDGSIGVFASSTASGYLMDNLMSHRDPRTLVGEGVTVEMFNLVLLNDKDFLATRVSHELNLRGPSLSVQTACSSSLVAVHLACQSLLSGECDMALTGASAVRVPHRVGYTYEPGAMVSPSGHCRPFDANSDGTIFGSGVAALILKPLQAALDDGDRIHAVIRGSAINNDGANKVGFTAPSAEGQAGVLAEALWSDEPADRLRKVLVPQALELRRAAVLGDGPAALATLDEHRLLCAHRRGPYGVAYWNRQVERWLAEETDTPLWSTWYLGRPILVTANDYGLRLYNGDTGVTLMRDGALRAVVAGSEGPVEFATSRLADVETMHAMTIHKSQGSQATEVTVLLPPEDSRLLTRELLYTAVTRAREKVRVIGTAEQLRAAVARRAVRASGLARRLR